MNTNENKVMLNLRLGEVVEVTPTNIDTLLKIKGAVVAQEVTRRRREFSKDDWVKINDRIIEWLNIGRDANIPPYKMNLYGVDMRSAVGDPDEDMESDSYRTIMASEAENNPWERMGAVAGIFSGEASRMVDDRYKQYAESKEVVSTKTGFEPYVMFFFEDGQSIALSSAGLESILEMGGRKALKEVIANLRILPQDEQRKIIKLIQTRADVDSVILTPMASAAEQNKGGTLEEVVAFTGKRPGERMTEREIFKMPSVFAYNPFPFYQTEIGRIVNDTDHLVENGLVRRSQLEQMFHEGVKGALRGPVTIAFSIPTKSDDLLLSALSTSESLKQSSPWLNSIANLGVNNYTNRLNNKRKGSRKIVRFISKELGALSMLDPSDIQLPSVLPRDTRAWREIKRHYNGWVSRIWEEAGHPTDLREMDGYWTREGTRKKPSGSMRKKAKFRSLTSNTHWIGEDYKD